MDVVFDPYFSNGTYLSRRFTAILPIYLNVHFFAIYLSYKRECFLLPIITLLCFSRNSFGVVYKGEWKGTMVAIKRLRGNDDM